MQTHILNGDALTDRMTAAGFDNLYVCRAALIEGPQGPRDEREMERMKEIPSDADINLWFADDLFCQANMWFMIDYLYSLDRHHRLYRVFNLINDNRWGDYARHTPDDFKTCYNNRVAFTPEDVQLALNLWTAYSNNDFETLQTLSHTESPCFRFLPEVAQAHIERFTVHRPEQTLTDIIQGGATDFSTIFKTFYTKEGIYGFGDTQVQDLLQKIQPR